MFISEEPELRSGFVVRVHNCEWHPSADELFDMTKRVAVEEPSECPF
jgi:hypothetical protein